MFQVRSYLTTDIYNNKVRYCHKQDLTQKALYNKYVRNCSSNKISSVCFNTFRKYWNMLFTKGLIENRQITTHKGEKINAYVLPQEFKIYKLVPKDTMKFLVNTTNGNVIKIYAYLLNKRDYKENYTFTLKELVANALGYNPDTNGIESKANDCLKLLNMIGLIKYENIFEKNNNNKPVPKKKLIMVSDKIKEDPIKTTDTMLFIPPNQTRYETSASFRF